MMLLPKNSHRSEKKHKKNLPDVGRLNKMAKSCYGGKNVMPLLTLRGEPVDEVRKKMKIKGCRLSPPLVCKEWLSCRARGYDMEILPVCASKSGW